MPRLYLKRGCSSTEEASRLRLETTVRAFQDQQANREAQFVSEVIVSSKSPHHVFRSIQSLSFGDSRHDHGLLPSQ
jgi:hypothetical protein